MKKRLNIVIPMAGAGSRFAAAGYSFPKPLIDVNGKPMIQLIVENLKPKCEHRFIFICRGEHFEQYSLPQIFSRIAGNNYESIQINALTAGAATTVLTAVDLINSDEDLMIANADQIIDVDINTFISSARKSGADGTIMTFNSSHPKWSYARVDKKGNVLETVEKKVISDHATVGIYYFSHGKDFVEGAFSMIEKNIRLNNEFYVCPVYNELILKDKQIKISEIKSKQMHGLGTPEDLAQYLAYLEKHPKGKK
jgi:NDP-sugar pyrophosphorylase family protein